MDNQLEIIETALDQPLPIQPLVVLDKVEDVFAQSIKDKDPAIAFNAAKILIAATRIAGLGMAKLLFLMRDNWPQYHVPDNFEDVAYEAIGLSKVTISRYIRIWEMFYSKDVPPQIVENLQQRPIKDLSAIATTWAGYPIPDDKWEELAHAEDNSTVLEILREIKGEEPRKNSIILRLERNGTIRAWNRDQGHFVGYLNLDDGKDNEIVGKAIERIINGAGIMRE
jgi:hypothetical protein